ncbi:hypothetical protein B484DRAFT_396060, partial [Ochromonadaceae sp. CCMP2298]
MDRDNSFLEASPQRFRGFVVGQPLEICPITQELIAEVSGSTQAGLSSLQVLDLHLRDERKGKIRKIENMALVPGLRQLNLSYNAITRIEGLGRLHLLVELNLAENAVRHIDGLASLSALERLNLSGNQIQRIPESISTLRKLTHLRIARNDLDVVADLSHLSQLPSLASLRLDENPFSAPHTQLFAIYSVRSLSSLDGETVTPEARAAAKRRFAHASSLPELRGRLEQETQALRQMRTE